LRSKEKCEGERVTEEELKILKEFQKDTQWLIENYQKLKKEFVDRFVAIKNGKVIESDENLDKLIEKLQKKGEDASKTVIEFIPPEDMIIIL